MNKNLMTAEHYASNVSFQAYCAKSDEEAIQYWTNYLNDHPDQAENIREAKKIVQFLSLQISEKEILAEKAKIKPHFLKAAAKTKADAIKDRPINIWRIVASVAAVGLLLIAAGTFWFSQQQINDADFITQSFKEATKVELSDGSSIFLAPDASIKHEAAWEENDDREIWLTGKAFFDVNNQPLTGKQKFLVHTQRGQVEVLGTSFTIDNTKGFEVILETGKLAFRSLQDQTAILKPGEKVSFSENGQLVKEQVTATHYSIWKEEQLIFEDTPVAEIVAVLEASFDLNIEIDNQKLQQRKITAAIPKNDPELLLQALSEIYDIRIIRSADKIILK